MDEMTPAPARHDGPHEATDDGDGPGPGDGPAPGDGAGRDEPAAADRRDAAVRPVDLRDYVEPVPGEATCRRVYASTQLAVDVWCVEPRQATGALHLPERDVSYTVIAGRSWFVTDDGEVGLDPLGAILIPADVVHGFENRAPDPLIVVATSAPPGDIPEDPPVATDAAAVTFERPSGRLRGVIESLLGTRGPQPG
ncbi:MAG: hypothetical protein JJT89_08425 [Nitriliruptoraceae bacterium]|nr:hypothetical protein [Nitriliruptoraceae bacterium]